MRIVQNADGLYGIRRFLWYKDLNDYGDNFWWCERSRHIYDCFVNKEKLEYYVRYMGWVILPNGKVINKTTSKIKPVKSW